MNTPMHILNSLKSSISENKFKKVEELLKNGVNVNESYYDGNTFLHSAALQGSSECIEVLLKFGATINCKNFDGDTPLHLALRKKNIDAAILLFKNGSKMTEVNNRNETCSDVAVANGFFEDSLEKGEDILCRCKDIVNEKGDHLIHVAAETGSVKLFGILLNYSEFDVNFRNRIGQTPLHRALHSNRLDMVKFLLRKGANPNLFDEFGYTPLHICAEMGWDADFVKILVDYGSNIDAKGHMVNTPLHLACKAWDRKLIITLLRLGADTNVKSNGPLQQTALLERSPKYHSEVGFFCVEPVCHDLLTFIAYHEEKDLKVNEDHIKKIDSLPSFSKHYARCKDILKIMKAERISEDSKVTYFDLMLNNENFLAKCIRSSEIENRIRKRLIFFCPYEKILEKNVEEGLERRRLLEKAHKIFTANIYHLPYICVRKILEQIKNADLEVFNEIENNKET